MIEPKSVTLRGHGVLLEPLRRSHIDDLIAAATDGQLWELWFTAVPTPDQAESYIEKALTGQRDGTMLPWLVRDDATGEAIGTTRYHDIVASIDRVEIGYTFYRLGRQRTHVNAACKLLLLSHAFESLGCEVVGLRTDRFNFASQRAIERLGAKKDGLIRHHAARRDGSVRDTVMYSILAAEWPDVRRHLELRLANSLSSSRGTSS
ncbi:MAG TPA: GNAT family N-acetyltransferase [Kribbella sp.]|nr:GNAT family N-acetyltransferase [Kribbella sp.]